jgi:flagellar basal-body rod modification protein FlgD
MMLSAATNATAAANATANSSSDSTISKDEFLQLFVTQLKNQDPLNPMDSAGFTAQLAQFSSLEQLTNINDGVTSLLAYENSLQNAVAASLIGKQVGYQVKGADGNAGDVQHGTVTGITFDSGKTSFIVDGTTAISPGDIQEIQ